MLKTFTKQTISQYFQCFCYACTIQMTSWGEPKQVEIVFSYMYTYAILCWYFVYGEE